MGRISSSATIAADRRPHDRPGIEHELVERDGALESLGRDEARDRGGTSRLVHGPEPGADERQQVDAGDWWLGHEREQGQPHRDDREADLGRDEEPPPVHGIGDRAAAQREHEDREQLDQRQGADREDLAGQDVDLVRQHDHRDHPAGGADGLAGPEQPEVAVQAERGRVDDQGAEAAAAGRGRGGHRPPSSHRCRCHGPSLAVPGTSRGSGTGHDRRS
jgi:hypothetical protein